VCLKSAVFAMIRLPARRRRDFLCSQTSRQTQGPHPHSYRVGTWIFIRREENRPGRGVEHSPSCSTDGENGWKFSSIPARYLHGVAKGNFALNF